jgi:hypothetical protein
MKTPATETLKAARSTHAYEMKLLRRRCARLERALSAFARDAYYLARNSYEVNGRFNDDVWESADRVSYRLWRAAKRALA